MRKRNKDVGGLRAAEMKRRQQAMTEDEIDDAIIKAIIDAVTERGAATQADLAATNVPPASITRRYRHCFAIAEEREPRLRHMMREAA